MLRTLSLTALLVALGAPVLATTVLDVPIERMAKESPVVVEGVVAARESAWTADRGRIVTHTRIKLSRVRKGTDASELVLWQGGGTLDGVTHAIPGDASFTEGEEVLLFLEPHPREAGAFVLVAMAAAKFSLEKTADGVVARRDLSELGLVRPDADGVLRPGAPSGTETVSLDALRATIERNLR